MTSLAVLSLGPGAITAHAAPTVYTIGVDNASPAGRNFQYTDFFPRGGVNILSGDVIDFKWSTASLDGFHTATLIKTGDTPQAVYDATPPVVPDADDGASVIEENPAQGAPSNPACGTVGTPCTFDGTALVNSGAFPTAPGNDFYVTITAAAGTTVNYLCFIHPGMVGSLSVVASGASTTAAVDAAGAAQHTADTAEAEAARSAVSVPGPTTNADGTKTWNVLAGAEAQHEQVLEFFPTNLAIKAGDSVKWTSAVHDIHTATFPDGAASAGVDFHQFVCEAGPPDTPAAAPPAPPCANPANFESHSTPAPSGPTTLVSPATVATSGLIAAAPLPFPGNYTFKVAGAGTYTYQCKVHDHMVGAVDAASVTLPKASAGTESTPASSPGSPPTPLALLALASLVVLAGAAAWGRRLTR